MKWNKKFTYPKTVREAIEGERHYSINDEKLPSVTTILQATQSDEKKASLERWKNNVGNVAAENIKNEAANRGSKNMIPIPMLARISDIFPEVEKS